MSQHRSGSARVPLDVDLEDKLLFGLAPLRFGYLAVALVAAFTVADLREGGGALRVAAALAIAALGAAAAWGEYLGRSADEWVLDFGRYCWANSELVVRGHGMTPAGVLAWIGQSIPLASVVVEDLDGAGRAPEIAAELASRTGTRVRSTPASFADTVVAISSHARPRSRIRTSTRARRVALVVPVEDGDGAIQEDAAGFDLVVALPMTAPARADMLGRLVASLFHLPDAAAA